MKKLVTIGLLLFGADVFAGDECMAGHTKRPTAYVPRHDPAMMKTSGPSEAPAEANVTSYSARDAMKLSHRVRRPQEAEYSSLR